MSNIYKKKKTLKTKLHQYKELKDSVKAPLRPSTQNLSVKDVLPLGAAFLASVPLVDAAIVTGSVNATVTEFSPNIQVGIDGGVDMIFRIIGSGTGNQENIQVSGPGVQGFKASKVGSFNYPFAMLTSDVISGTVMKGGGFLNTLQNEYYNAGDWLNLPNGTERFLGFRLNSGNYGWIRIQKNNSASITILDWAYEDTGASIAAGIAVPVELQLFEITKSGNGAHLHWETASEINNAGFEIERSLDGKQFQNIAWIEGAGSTTAFQAYDYEDKNLRSGMTYYYRLKQVDFDGRYEYSNVLTISTDLTDVNIGDFYPNPAASSVTINMDVLTTEEWLITVYDALGRSLKEERQVLNFGANNWDLDVSGLAKGKYFVKLESPSLRVYRNLNIQ